MKSPFLFNVSSMAGKTGASAEVDVEANLEGLRTSSSWVPDETPVEFHGSAITTDGGMVVEGQLTTSWVGECRRCTTEATGHIDAHFREIFEKESTEGETYPVEGDYIDLELPLREAVMLELPVAPLCKPDCKGLCPECGANKNDVDCGHTGEVKDLRWAALDQLRDP